MYTSSFVPFGYDGIIIRVEADIRRGIPGIDISGLAEGAVREARERVRAAFRNSGYQFPQDRILINLAPAGVKKYGASLDLPIALAVMAASGLIPSPEALMVMGELELSGRLRPVRGVLAALAAALDAGITDFIVPRENAGEAAILAGGHYAAVSSLDEAVQALFERRESGRFARFDGFDGHSPQNGSGAFLENRPFGDFAEVCGQKRYKRVMELAAAGGHNLLVFGPPGAGKTMLARRLPSIMPPLLTGEAVEVTRLYSLAGQLGMGGSGEPYGGGEPLCGGEPLRGSLIERPPFRAPHHSASAEGILGGGRTVHPGEISLAHNGVLFLDEAPEFHVNVLQALREPLEDRVVTIVRAEGPVRLPADFQLLLAANPCPCGRLGKKHGEDCYCSAEQIRRYWRKMGGALLDRLELRVAVNAPEGIARRNEAEEKSSVIAARVLRAVEIQRARFAGSAIRRNAGMSPEFIDKHCALTDRAADALASAVEKLMFSGRACHGVLRVARTIADLDGKDAIDTVHILEAVQHRRSGDDPFDIFQAAG